MQGDSIDYPADDFRFSLLDYFEDYPPPVLTTLLVKTGRVDVDVSERFRKCYDAVGRCHGII